MKARIWMIAVVLGTVPSSGLAAQQWGAPDRASFEATTEVVDLVRADDAAWRLVRATMPDLRVGQPAAQNVERVTAMNARGDLVAFWATEPLPQLVSVRVGVGTEIAPLQSSPRPAGATSWQATSVSRDALAINNGGQVVVAWNDWRGATLVASRGPDGALSAPLQLSSPGAVTGGRVSALNDAGAAIVVWEETGSGGRATLRWSRRSSPESAWSPAANVAESARDFGDGPRLVMDDAGTATLVWADEANALLPSLGNFRTARLSSSAASWHFDEPLPAVSYETPRLAVSPGGQVVLVWPGVIGEMTADPTKARLGTLVSRRRADGTWAASAALDGLVPTSVAINDAGRIVVLASRVETRPPSSNDAIAAIPLGVVLDPGGAPRIDRLDLPALGTRQLRAIGVDANGDAAALWVGPIGRGARTQANWARFAEGQVPIARRPTRVLRVLTPKSPQVGSKVWLRVKLSQPVAGATLRVYRSGGSRLTLMAARRVSGQTVFVPVRADRVGTISHVVTLTDRGTTARTKVFDVSVVPAVSRLVPIEGDIVDLGSAGSLLWVRTNTTRGGMLQARNLRTARPVWPARRVDSDAFFSPTDRGAWVGSASTVRYLDGTTGAWDTPIDLNPRDGERATLVAGTDAGAWVNVRRQAAPMRRYLAYADRRARRVTRRIELPATDLTRFSSAHLSVDGKVAYLAMFDNFDPEDTATWRIDLTTGEVKRRSGAILSAFNATWRFGQAIQRIDPPNRAAPAPYDAEFLQYEEFAAYAVAPDAAWGLAPGYGLSTDNAPPRVYPTRVRRFDPVTSRFSVPIPVGPPLQPMPSAEGTAWRLAGAPGGLWVSSPPHGALVWIPRSLARPGVQPKSPFDGVGSEPTGFDRRTRGALVRASGAPSASARVAP